MLLINPEVACFVVAKAREFGAKVELDDPDSGSNPADDKSIDVLEDYADDPTLDELRGAIDSMNEDESRDLVAMMWIGRGDFDSQRVSRVVKPVRHCVLDDLQRDIHALRARQDFLDIAGDRDDALGVETFEDRQEAREPTDALQLDFRHLAVGGRYHHHHIDQCLVHRDLFRHRPRAGTRHD